MPQFFESVCRSTQAPEQSERPALHWHWLFTQSRVESQTLSQVPQWAGFAERSSQPLPQSRVPKAQAQVLPEHSVPPVHWVVQSPQWFASKWVLKHPSAHIS